MNIMKVWIILLLNVFIYRESTTEYKVVINSANFGIDDPNVVDIVITWVNGSDPKWFHQMKEDAAKANITISPQYSQDRYVPHDEIKWALRSIESFLPWYNMIHIVTDKKYPSWIRKDHPKIHWVDHDTIFHNGYHSYSSTAIQFSFVYIPNISRRFIIMDDDCIFLNNLTINDFYDDECRTKMYTSNVIVPNPKCNVENGASQYHYSRWLSYNIMKSKFNLSRTLSDAHMLLPLDMNVLFSLESQIDVTETRYEMFRKCGTYQFPTLYIQYSYVMNRAILLRDRNYRVIFTNSELNRFFRAKRLPKMACVNFYNQTYFDNFLPSVLPNQSSFEL